VLRNDYEKQVCSIAGALEVVGERWSLLIIRDVMLGLHRFEELQSDLGIARNVLQTRLERLVGEGVLERIPYQQRPLRHEYRLTEKGLDLWPTVFALMRWGDAYTPPDGGPATVVEHRDCGGAVDEHRICSRCGARLTMPEVTAKVGPGGSPAHPLLRGRGRSANASV
jgi:DNA-binding HxlR family transcriptional regulator